MNKHFKIFIKGLWYALCAALMVWLFGRAIYNGEVLGRFDRACYQLLLAAIFYWFRPWQTRNYALAWLNDMIIKSAKKEKEDLNGNLQGVREGLEKSPHRYNS